MNLSQSTIILTPWELVGLLSVDQSPSMDIFGIKMQIGLFPGTNSFIGLQADAEILDVSYFEKGYCFSFLSTNTKGV